MAAAFFVFRYANYTPLRRQLSIVFRNFSEKIIMQKCVCFPHRAVAGDCRIFSAYINAQACGRAGVRRACGRAGAQNIYINKAHLLLGLLGFWLLGCFWSFCFWGYLLILIVIWLLVTLTVTLPIFITISRFSSSSLSLLLAVSSFSDNICKLSLSSAFSFAAFS